MIFLCCLNKTLVALLIMKLHFTVYSTDVDEKKNRNLYQKNVHVQKYENIYLY
jgi:hypothetical protein